MTTVLPEPAGPIEIEANKRREERYALHTNAVVHRGEGEPFEGSTVNVSGSGVLLDLAESGDLHVGDEVSCSIELYEGKPPQPWGVGRVVRIENSRIAIEFTGI